MSTSESFEALRRANPRGKDGFGPSVEAAAAAVRTGIATAGARELSSRPRRRRRLVRLTAASATLVAAAAIALSVVGGSPGGENAAAAFERAATITAASAERSGTAVVALTHDGRPWAGRTVRWNGADVAIAEQGRRRAGSELRVVDGTLYGRDHRGRWLALGAPESIDPGSGTTPDEHLAAVREDVGGETLRRLTGAMTGLTTITGADGSTVYRGTVPARVIAGGSGVKDGQPIRVLPFGYVAHDEAADPSARLDTTVTVGADGVVRQLRATWGTWTYTVTYTGLDATPAPVAPANARPLERGPRR